MPFTLAQPSDVEITIYDVNGQLIRRLELGHRDTGVYQNKNRAAYWDGKNADGEPATSGVYFYQLRAGHETFVHKALLMK